MDLGECAGRDRTGSTCFQHTLDSDDEINRDKPSWAFTPAKAQCQLSQPEAWAEASLRLCEIAILPGDFCTILRLELLS